MAGTAYTTETKEEIRILDKAQQLKVFYRIFATTKKGTYFHVDVAEDNLDQADALLQARAQKLDAI